MKKFRIYSGKPKYISGAEIQGSWEREKQEKKSLEMKTGESPKKFLNTTQKDNFRDSIIFVPKRDT